MRAVLYVAHCLRPTEAEIMANMPTEAANVGLAEWTERYPGDVKRHTEAALRRNLDCAMAWLSWLRCSFLETTFIAPWIAALLSGADDTDRAQREAGIADACAVIERCDGIVLCGPRLSDGMRREMEHGARAARGPGREVFAVYDMTGDRAYMPSDVELRTDQTWPEWARALRI